MSPPSNRVTDHRRLNSSSNQDMDSMRGFGDSAHYGNMRSKFAYGGFMEGKEALQYRDMDSMRGFGNSAHYGNMRSKFAYGGFMEGKEALQYRDMDSMRGFGVSAHYGNEEFDMRSNFVFGGFVEGKEALKYGDMDSMRGFGDSAHYGNMRSKFAYGGFMEGKEALQYRGNALAGPPSIYRAMRQLPEGVKPRGPYRALTFQEKEYYRKRAEESRGFDVPDIPDDIDPCEIEVKPFKLDQHPPGSKLWKKVERLAHYSKLALDKYNKCNSAANYQFAKLIKANCKGGYPIEYFITFQAYDMACCRCKTFRANVSIGFKETSANCWPEPYPTSRRSSHNIDAGAVACSSADQY